MAPSERRKRALYRARGLPPSLGVTGAWFTQRKMAVNGCVFKLGFWYLRLKCGYGGLLVNNVCLRTEEAVFWQGERSKWDGWLDVGF